MIGALFALGKLTIGSTFARLITIGLLSLGTVTAWSYYQQSLGKQKLVRASIKQGLKNNARAEKIRRKIYTGTGSVGALPCRDCD